jgi:outer membrane immunogenic protein
MRNALLASVAVIAMIGQAEAQEAGYNWSGFYVGAQAGYGWSSAEFSGTSAVPEGDHDEDGFVGGIHAGYDWREDRWVYGFIGDVNYIDVDEIGLNGEIPPGNGPFSGKDESYTYDIDWVATARARIGFTPTDRLLVYGTGGAAFAHVQATERLEVFGGSSSSNSNVEVGGVLGLGAEFAVGQNWSVKAEYLHHDFGKLPTESGDNDGPGFSPSLDTVTLGVSFRFGP